MPLREIPRQTFGSGHEVTLREIPRQKFGSGHRPAAIAARLRPYRRSTLRLTSNAIVELSTANPPAGNQQRPDPHEWRVLDRAAAAADHSQRLKHGSTVRESFVI